MKTHVRSHFRVTRLRTRRFGRHHRFVQGPGSIQPVSENRWLSLVCTREKNFIIFHCVPIGCARFGGALDDCTPPVTGPTLVVDPSVRPCGPSHPGRTTVNRTVPRSFRRPRDRVPDDKRRSGSTNSTGTGASRCGRISRSSGTATTRERNPAPGRTQRGVNTESFLTGRRGQRATENRPGPAPRPRCGRRRPEQGDDRRDRVGDTRGSPSGRPTPTEVGCDGRANSVTDRPDGRFGDRFETDDPVEGLGDAPCRTGRREGQSRTTRERRSRVHRRRSVPTRSSARRWRRRPHGPTTTLPSRPDSGPARFSIH